MKNGYAVYGHDHLGHGETSPDDRGFFAEKNGDVILVDDVRRVAERIESDYPDIPHFVFGFSLGSLVVRRYIAEYGDTVDGAVIMATGGFGPMKCRFSIFGLNLLIKIKGCRARSKFVNGMAFGGYNKHFPGECPIRWLTSDVSSQECYIHDRKCRFSFTLAAYRDVMVLAKKLNKELNFDRIPKDIKLLFVSGSDDPFGDFGKGVTAAQGTLGRYGIESEAIFYEGDRHSLISEKNREEVFSDIVGWLDNSI